MSGGVIRAYGECHCARCERPALGLRWPKRRAEQELRLEGWGLKKGRWVCPSCKALSTPSISRGGEHD